MKSLRARLMLGLIGLAAVALVIVDAISYLELRSYLYQRVDQQVASAVDPVSRTLVFTPPPSRRTGAAPGGSRLPAAPPPRVPALPFPGPPPTGQPPDELHVPPGTYGVLLRQMLANVAQGAANDPDAGAHPLLAVRPEQRILLVVITADSGLAGAFNSNLIKMAHRFADERKNATLTFELIGKKGVNYFRRRFNSISLSFP